MGGLILEIQTRHDRHYVPLDKPLLRVGRALDNDLILSDPTVSAHHFSIKRTAAQDYVLVPLDDENGTRIDGRVVDAPQPLEARATTVDVGRSRGRRSRSRSRSRDRVQRRRRCWRALRRPIRRPATMRRFASRAGPPGHARHLDHLHFTG